MRQKLGTKASHGEKVVKDIRRATRKQYSAEEKIRTIMGARWVFSPHTNITIMVKSLILLVQLVF